MYRAKIEITLRPSILDPQGKATQNALHNLGYVRIERVRIGKLMELNINAASEEEAAEITENACKELLANTVMEDYTFDIEDLETA